jgi:hypothetical protein
MKKDALFLLKRDFEDQAQPGKKFVCPECVFVEGLLGYYPQLREQIDISYLDFKRPRNEVIRLIGEENQSCPVLVLKDSPHELLQEEIPFGQKGTHFFVSGQEDIARYLMIVYSIGQLH